MFNPSKKFKPEHTHFCYRYWDTGCKQEADYLISKYESDLLLAREKFTHCHKQILKRKSLYFSDSFVHFSFSRFLVKST